MGPLPQDSRYGPPFRVRRSAWEYPTNDPTSGYTRLPTRTPTAREVWRSPLVRLLVATQALLLVALVAVLVAVAQ